MPRSIRPAFAGIIVFTARTTIALPTTRAKFLRITPTDTVADAPPWSIRNLRIYEAPAAGARK